MLSIQRPTPTTVLYTVSTRAPPTTWPAWIAHHALLGERLLAGILLATLLLREYAAAFLTTPPPLHPHGLFATFAIILRNTVTTYFLAQPWPWRTLTLLTTAHLVLTKAHPSESLLVIRGLGVQTSTSGGGGGYGGWSSRRTRFIPTSRIQDLFIHEAFRGFEVRYYLSIVVEDEGEVVVVFPSILPRREVLEEVWRGAKACLYEPKG
ncbi:hypothetical protein LTR53_001986 [Teratosphaeriaceae sp. CCFEE 6253]|nr:hypothetical protein LTR53_001986 [Teratosphaeriaceae sp. CCFEE 6253]